MPGREVVQLAEHHRPASVSAVRPLTGMIGGPAGNVGQNVPAAIIDAQITRRIRVPRRFQEAEQPRRERAARLASAADRVTDPHDLASVTPSRQRFFAHQSKSMPPAS